MQLDNNSFYRRSITSWYDSNFACRLSISLAAVVLFFAGNGLNAALKNNAYKDFIWLPLLLGGLCLFIIIKTALRLTKRNRIP